MEPFHIHESKHTERLEHQHLGGFYHAHYHDEKYGSPKWFCGCSLKVGQHVPEPHDSCPNRKDD